MDNRKISLCITTWNRNEMLFESFAKVLDDERISEIIISDDASDIEIYNSVQETVNALNKICGYKILLYRNELNLDCYFNKYQSINLSSSDYCVIIDSDNIIGTDYLDAIYSEDWNEDTILQPCFAKPHFDFRAFEGLIITKENVAYYMDAPMFSTMCNASNYFVNRDMYLKCFDDSVNPHTAEAIFTNYNWLKAGNKIKVVKGMEYEHRVHAGSHYQNNNHLTGNFYNEIENRLRQLK